MRDMTQAELAAKDTAWELYLDDVTAAEPPRTARESWDRYQEVLDSHGIVPTLAGYRVSVAPKMADAAQ